MPRFTAEQLSFLEQPFAGVATTIRPDGSPHNTVVWVDVEDGIVSFNTLYGRAKPRHLERDPRVGLIVVDPNDQHRWVAVDGEAELTTDGADEQIDRLTRKYTGRGYRSREGEHHVTVRIRPRRITASGFD
jgi:PPOX class probable F420-dependent enzyme